MLYADAGVNYKTLAAFKAKMAAVSKKTLKFPNRRGVYFDQHGVCQYRGEGNPKWFSRLEGLGNKSWVAAFMQLRQPNGPSYMHTVAYDTAMMAVNDTLVTGALPVELLDEIATNESIWFEDQRRADDFIRGIYKACKDAGMALTGGETGAYKYLIGPRRPVKEATVLSCAVNGIINPPESQITGEKLQKGDRIIGVKSTGIHASGAAFMINWIMDDPHRGERGWQGLPDEMYTRMRSGKTVGEALLVRTRCYVRLVEWLLKAGVEIHALQPITGGGVGKIAYDKRDFTYRIHHWLPVPEVMRYMNQDIQNPIPLLQCLKVFNWGVGFCIFVPENEVQKVLEVARRCRFRAAEIGVVEEGKREVIFGPEKDLAIPPPGE